MCATRQAACAWMAGRGSDVECSLCSARLLSSSRRSLIRRLPIHPRFSFVAAIACTRLPTPSCHAAVPYPLFYLQKRDQEDKVKPPVTVCGARFPCSTTVRVRGFPHRSAEEGLQVCGIPGCTPTAVSRLSSRSSLPARWSR